ILFQQTNGVAVTVLSPLDTVNLGSRSYLLDMSFKNFLPGRFIQFTAELDTPSAESFENYQTVFFVVGGDPGNVSNNLGLSATFDTGQVLFSRMPNYVSGSQPPFVFKQTGQSGVGVNQTHPELLVGGSDQNVIAFDTDFGGFQNYADDPLGILKA